ncbi:hypothetical protein COV11_03735 [Candidatus Woesearchaeota archaeon CG10_big_fil_rev_8_21_14_0_10_30_7]|nr:MAG: hypothetical protein COV11_03735 [Candidatus Woesearchaeota archaeon CG10_big_fil_rev_8_21_14_0_10_30_7]
MVLQLAKRLLGIPYVRDVVGDEKHACFFIREGQIDYCLRVIQNENSVTYGLQERFRKRPFWDKNECGYNLER